MTPYYTQARRRERGAFYKILILCGEMVWYHLKVSRDKMKMYSIKESKKDCS